MLNALAESVREHMKDNFGLGVQIEGEPQNGWLLADYGDVVIHIFSPDQREYYQLEDLWADGRVLVHLQ
jgi:ribosome-associated protein